MAQLFQEMLRQLENEGKDKESINTSKKFLGIASLTTVRINNNCELKNPDSALSGFFLFVFNIKSLMRNLSYFGSF